MIRYFLTLDYNGTNYHGWQVQNNALSVQALLNKALSILLKQNISTTGAGRTDAGVHAQNYVCHFDSNLSINNKQIFIYKLNHILPRDIGIKNLIEVNPSAHARFDAISRTYRYFICQQKNVFEEPFRWLIESHLDIELMQEAASKLLLYEDFTSFSKQNTATNNNNCKIYAAKWFTENGDLIFEITANRFLHGMVRSIVGTLIDVGKKKISVSDFEHIIQCKDRSLAGISAPAKALFLINITYPQRVFDLE